MSRTTSPTVTQSQEQVVWPDSTPSTTHFSFIERLKRARIERGLSIPDMADRVGLGLRLAHEFEDVVTPLPFSHLELWCEAVGVPFADYLSIYWAEEREIRECEEREAEQKAPCITNTTSDETAAPALSYSPRGCGILNFLRSLVAHIRERFLSRFSTCEQKPE